MRSGQIGIEDVCLCVDILWLFRNCGFISVGQMQKKAWKPGL